MPKVELKHTATVEQNADGSWSGSITLRNDSTTPALMIRVNVVGEKDGDQILPIFYSDNYVSLLGGEQRQISFRFKDEDTRGNKPKVVVTGYNVQ
jgi:hypothetical protein